MFKENKNLLPVVHKSDFSYKVNKCWSKKHEKKCHGGGKDWEFGISRCKHLHIEQINKHVLLYSTGNNSQYSVINQTGKECEKDYIYVKLNHFALQQK